MLKKTIVSLLIASIGVPAFSNAQVFDEKITPTYYYRILNNLPAISEAYKFLDEINDASSNRVSIPASALLDLRIYGMDEKVAVPFYAALERFNYIYSNKSDTINAIEKILDIERIPTTFKLAAIVSLAVITHNNSDYLKSIKYINWFHSYTSARRHQFYYMLADNYLNLGDKRNALISYNKAKVIKQKYLEGGVDMRDELGIENYNNIVSDLNAELGNLKVTDIQKNLTVDLTIPPITDEFWIAKLSPKFPKAAIGKGPTGYVTFNFDLDHLGNPQNVSITDQSNSLFKKPAMTFIKDMKYIQYEAPSNEENIATDVTYRLDFQYKK